MGWVTFKEIREGLITDASFVANVWRVYINSTDIDPRYSDPIKFFQRTYISEGLAHVLENTLQRLSGKGGDPIILLKTTFGGGKTHTLIAIYHLCLNLPAVLKCENVVSSLRAPTFAVKPAVVVFDGFEVDPRRLRDVYNANNLWQFLLLKLASAAGSELAKTVAYDYSDSYEPPGSEVLSTVLSDIEGQGYAAVILLDEIPEFLKRLAYKDGRLAQATHSFIAALARAMVYTRYSLLVMALPDVPVYSEENKIIEDMLRELKRVSMPKNIVSKEDAAYVLRQALIEDVNVNVGRSRSRDYFSVYTRFRTDFPSKASAEGYLDKLSTHYPFHPQYVDFLYDKLSTAPGFQGTRDMLRLTARALHAMYKRGLVGDFVLLSDIDVMDSNILDELLERHGYRNLRVAIEGDLEAVKRVDEENVKRGLPALASRIYSALLVFSVSGEPASVRDITLAVVRPGIPPPAVARVLEYLYEEKAAHIHRVSEGAELKYLIKERANWRRLVEIKANEISDEVAREALKKNVKDAVRVWGRRIFRGVSIWPSSPTEIGESPQPRIVLLDPKSVLGPEGTLNRTLNFFAFYSDAARREFRQFKNALFFLIPNPQAYETGLREAKRVFAADALKRAKDQYGLTEEDINELKDFMAKKTEDLRRVLPSAMYDRLAYPVGGTQEGLEFEIISIRDAEGSNPIEKAIYVLKADQKLIDRLGSDYLLDILRKLRDAGEEEPTIKRLIEVFAEDPHKPYLLNARDNLKGALARLTKDGLVVIVRGNNIFHERLPDHIMDDDKVILEEVARARGLLEKIEEAITEAVQALPEETKRAEEVSAAPRPSELSLPLNNKGLADLIESLKGGKLLQLRISKESDRDVTDVLRFFKSLATTFEGLEDKGYRLRLQLFSEISDSERLRRLSIQGEARTSRVIKETLTTLEQLGAKSVRCHLFLERTPESEPLAVDEIARRLNTAILIERFKKLRFNARLRILQD